MRGRPLIAGDPRTKAISQLGARATQVTFQRRKPIARKPQRKERAA